jgi:hypothetical protein
LFSGSLASTTVARTLPGDTFPSSLAMAYPASVWLRNSASDVTRNIRIRRQNECGPSLTSQRMPLSFRDSSFGLLLMKSFLHPFDITVHFRIFPLLPLGLGFASPALHDPGAACLQ